MDERRNTGSADGFWLGPSAVADDLSQLPHPHPWMLQTVILTATNAAYEGSPFAKFFQFEKGIGRRY